MFLQDHLMLREFLIVLLFLAAFVGLTIAMINVLEARYMAKRKHCLLARETFKIAVGQKGVTHSVEDAVVELITLLRGCPYTLRVLAAQNKPISFQNVLQKVWQEPNSHNESSLIPASAIRAILRLLQGPGFVRLDGDGFFITDLGKELYKRIKRLPGNESTTKRCKYDMTHSELG
jgi:hypothetical protein